MPLDSTQSPVAAKRLAACKTLMRQVRAITAQGGVTPSALHALKGKLVSLAGRTDLFPVGDFAMPETQGRTHPVYVEDGDGMGLYLTIGLPGKEAAAHAHNIWCVNAGVSGRERHVFWRRTDDGAKPGVATVIETGAVVDVEPGAGMAMSDHDIHSTLVLGSEPAVALALYGYALSRFPPIYWFHPQFSAIRAQPSRRPGA